jgi:hypothetical protein
MVMHRELSSQRDKNQNSQAHVYVFLPAIQRDGIEYPRIMALHAMQDFIIVVIV